MGLIRSWVAGANDADCPFPLNNLPCGVFSVGDDAPRCGVAIGSGIGGLQEFETQFARMLTRGVDKVSPFFIPKLLLNSASGHVSTRFGIKGPNIAIATACASAANSIGSALRMIQYGDADVMVTGGTEA